MSSHRLAWLAVVCLLALVQPTAAQPTHTSPLQQAAVQTTAGSMRVATRVIPPLVVESEGKLTGFSIELWDAIAARMGRATTYHVEGDVSALLAAVREGRADVGISAISITSERDKIFDFSQPMLAAGLQIMVRGDGGVAGSPWRDLLRLVFSRSMLSWIVMALLFAMIPAHMVFYLERRHPTGIIDAEHYVPGIFQALWWSLAGLLTQADTMPRQWFARWLAIIWMFAGLVFVAYYTAQLTATLTVQQIRGAINGPDDLPGKRVATLRSSTSAVLVKQKRGQLLEVARIEEAYEALLGKRVEAVVFDAPVLQHFAGHDGKGRVQMVGSIFRKEDYGIAFPLGSSLRKQVDGTLLALREDGTMQRLHDKWFDGK